jgi:site-specific DNA recombinase
MREREKPKKLRCAIYTRKSSEEGLEQDFNSLQAQREACEAFILSQRHEGWTALPAAYDDGGFSGGTMERPALKRLLADIASGKVDAVVVYKVDRLTRSLADFAKIVEVFDRQGVSFVSVTQQFNTTTSMGRLTLNVLLSFAQFEREVTGERIRDKIAASKQKGMSMGGWVPLGYDRKDRTLVINEPEAQTVRTIFRLYLKRKSVRAVQTDLERLNLTTKRYVAATDRTMGGLPFRRGHIYHILSNPLYVGEIGHKDARHPGQHPALIDRNTWDAVQAQLRANWHANRTRANANAPSLLAGLLFDGDGNRLTATHATKNGKRYRYYAILSVSGRTASGRKRSTFSVPAAEIERIVVGQVVAFLTDSKRLLDGLHMTGPEPGSLSHALARGKQLASELEVGSVSEQCAIITEIVGRVVFGRGTVRIDLSREAIVARLFGQGLRSCEEDGAQAISIEMSITPRRRGTDMRLVIEGDHTQDAENRNPALIKAIARGHAWFDDLVSGRVASIAQIAKQEGVTDRYVSHLIGFSFVSPTVVEAVLEGRHVPGISVGVGFGSWRS